MFSPLALGLAFLLVLTVPGFAKDSRTCVHELTSWEELAAFDPAARYPGLFEAVQLGRVYKDSKHFVDMIPMYPTEKIMLDYRAEHPTTQQDLKSFVEARFKPFPEPSIEQLRAAPGVSIEQHIRNLWDVLGHYPEVETPYGSSLVIPRRRDGLTGVRRKFILPSPRFREFYYWDQMPTALGLLVHGRLDILDDTVNLFADQLHQFGRIFNGGRAYYRGRSQKPVYAQLVSLWGEAHSHKEAAEKFLPALKLEHDFWMRGSEGLKKAGQSHARVVCLGEGKFLNRYWSDTREPRPESYAEDIETGEKGRRLHNRDPRDVYQELAAGAEASWDFTSRFLQIPSDLSSIQVTSLLPIDLNSHLWYLEHKIAELSRLNNDFETAQRYEGMAAQRAALINQFLLDPVHRVYNDFNWKTGERSPRLTIAMTTPLYIGLPMPDDVPVQIGRLIKQRFLQRGGLLTTLQDTAQQWDYNKGWATLQWMAFVGFVRAGNFELANEILRRWLRTDQIVFDETRELKEKNNVLNPLDLAGGGEYAPESGFGMTNGVDVAFRHPEIALRYILGPLVDRITFTKLPNGLTVLSTKR